MSIIRMNRIRPASEPHRRSALAPVLAQLYGEKGDEFLQYLRQFGHVTYAANMTGLTRRTFYDRRLKNPAFAEAWDECVAAFEEELTHRVVQTALEMGTGKWVPVLDEAGEPVLDDQFERVFEFKTSHVDPRVLTKLLSLRMSSADGPATTNVQVNTMIDATPKASPRLIRPRLDDAVDLGGTESAETTEAIVRSPYEPLGLDEEEEDES
ncbi:MAG: hypothetical protein R3E44_09160 [Paracoccaceae bacterium]